MTKRGRGGHRQRLRERFLAGEENSRTEKALLELLLTYAIPQKDVQLLAHKLIEEFGSLPAVLAAPYEALCRLDGIKSNTVALLKLVDWIRLHHPTEKTDQTISDRSSSSEHAPLGSPEIQGTLFDVPVLDTPRQQIPAKRIRRPKKLAPQRGTGVFGKAVLKEAIQILPNLPDTESLDEIRSFLRANLHFNAEQTRHRYANYIIRRMFPNGFADKPLRFFAKTFPNTQALRDICFYRFLKSEPLQLDLIEHLILPNIGSGYVTRDQIRKYLSEKFPASRSIVDCGKAVVDALTAAGIVKANRKQISFAYRDIPVSSFAFVLHSEFPEPGMYDIRKIEKNRIIRAMLWSPERIIPSLYELRNRGIISKVSEIDNVRQFTTKWPLERVVEHLVDGGNIR